MVKLDIYSIYVETDERNGQTVALYDTFEECLVHRHEFANWWRPRGDVWIQHISGGNNFYPDEEWHINSDGKIISHYKHK